jgi:hypothetical protein
MDTQRQKETNNFTDFHRNDPKYSHTLPILFQTILSVGPWAALLFQAQSSVLPLFAGGGPPLLRFGATSPPAHGFGATNRSGRSSTTAANRFRAPFLAQMGELATKAKTLS